GQVAYNVQDLIELCRQFPDESSNYLLRGDFEKWLAYIGEAKFAQFAKESREAVMDESQKLSAFTAKYQSIAKQPNLETTPTQTTGETNAAKNKTKSSKVSWLAIFSQFLYNILSNRGKKNKEEVPIQQE
ncbi:MAG: hypothetical protein ACFCU5_00330, partial [Pleurocapsa sp.]